MRKNKLVILGASGHAKVVIDILKGSNQYDAMGCLDASVLRRETTRIFRDRFMGI